MSNTKLAAWYRALPDLERDGVSTCPACHGEGMELKGGEGGPLVPWCPHGCKPGEIRAAVRQRLAAGVGKNGNHAVVPASRARVAEAEWEEPLPLYSIKLPEFPIDALPSWLARMVRCTAEATQTPPDLAAMVSLSVLATAAQKRCEAVVREGWNEVLSLWTVTSLPPGNRKTPAYGPMVAPVQEFEQLLVERMRGEIAQAETEYEVMEGALKRLKDQATKAKNAYDREALTQQAVEIAEKLARMPRPKSPRLIADDATPEELGRLLASHAGRMAIISDEGDVFDLMAGKYSSGTANIGVYLRGHSGGDVIVDRVGRASVIVRRAAITFGLCVQPESLLGMTANQTFKGRGLIGRFLYSVPYSRLGDRSIRPAPLPLSVAADYSEKMTALLCLPAAVDEGGRPYAHPIAFSAEADDAVAAFEAWIEPQLRPGGDLGHMADWAGKLAGQMCRIATLLHLARSVDHREPWNILVPETTVLSARQIAEYLIPHAQSAFMAMGTHPAINGARELLDWLRQNPRVTFTKRDAHRSKQSLFLRADDVDEPLKVLLENGYIRQTVSDRSAPKGQPKSPTFLTHPTLRPN